MSKKLSRKCLTPNTTTGKRGNRHIKEELNVKGITQGQDHGKMVAEK